MAREFSAGLLPYRIRDGVLQVFIVHPGGPFWANKDIGVWSVAKGGCDLDEDPLDSAKREFKEETGYDAPAAKYLELGSVQYASRDKEVVTWAFETAEDYSKIQSETLSIEWPPRSGSRIDIPEIDKAAWFDAATARKKLNPNHIPFIDRLIEQLGPVQPDEGTSPAEQTSLL
ncbi:MAG TPA: NUDIX domain-containing protein [Candidatus Saccharimonadales bacterium]|jgi:predicted NUDIX family NTP pyrophosphohydrolase